MENNREIINPFIIHKPEEVIKPIWFMDYNKPHVGEIHKTNQGYDVIIIDYNHTKDIIVQFIDEYGAIKHTRYSRFKNGQINNPYHPGKHKGYIGVGEYKSNDIHLKIHQAWSNILYRTISDNQSYNKRNKAYINCSTCNEWYNYQNFAYWYDNYISSLNPLYYNDYQLDKDILQWNQPYKIYSPNTCCLVPKEINICLNSVYTQNKDVPPGVVKVNTYKIKYKAGIHLDTYTTIGIYDTPEEAFEAYVKIKKERLCFLADKYYSINAIKKEVYDALYNLEILPYGNIE